MLVHAAGVESRHVQHTFRSFLHAHIQHSIVQSAAHQKLERQVVNTLLIGERLILLRLVPLNDQAVSESQRSSRVCCKLIDVVQGACERGLDMSDHCIFELFGCCELASGLCTPSAISCLANSRNGVRTCFFQLYGQALAIYWFTLLEDAGHLRSSLSFRHTGFNSLDLLSSEASHRPLVLRPCNSWWTNRLLKVSDRRGSARLALTRHCQICRSHRSSHDCYWLTR